ncbi:MAG: prevent-host-death protein [Rickettsiaceae bacterium]|jgi:prevent-host-death family protein|nr:prevent-host-death protein [Rickettsiaceae bacterium]
MEIINVHEAKTHLSKLLNLIEKGQEFIIAKNGNPIAKLSPFKKSAERKGGQLRGLIHINEDFDDPLPASILNTFNGGSDE